MRRCSKFVRTNDECALNYEIVKSTNKFQYVYIVWSGFKLNFTNIHMANANITSECFTRKRPHNLYSFECIIRVQKICALFLAFILNIWIVYVILHFTVLYAFCNILHSVYDFYQFTYIHILFFSFLQQHHQKNLRNFVRILFIMFRE